MQEVAGERGGYLHGRGALDSDDLLYLKEQMEAEEDAERLLRRTEKRAFAAFKKAANLADSSPASVPLSLRVEPKPKSGIRQQDLLKKVVEIKPKRQRTSSPPDGNESTPSLIDSAPKNPNSVSYPKETGQLEINQTEKDQPLSRSDKAKEDAVDKNPVKGLLGLAYASSDEEED